MAKELLTDVTIRNAKPIEKDDRFNDGSDLITPSRAIGNQTDTRKKSKT